MTPTPDNDAANEYVSAEKMSALWYGEEKAEPSPTKTLKDVMPREFSSGEFYDIPAQRHRDVEVVAEHDPFEGGLRWPGPQRNVVVWYELANGKAVGWNENVARGWSFPVITYRKDT